MATGREISGEGFSVTILGRAGIKYKEGDKALIVDSEMLAGQFDFVVYTSSIQVWEGSNQPIASDDKQRILTNIQTALASEGLTVAFE